MTIKHLFPDAWPTLNLDFANELALDPRITFSRSSIGTYTDKNGIIQYAAEDEPRFDYDPETGESLGLLIEEFKTNELENSDLDGLTEYGCKTENSTEINPEGVASCRRIILDAGFTSGRAGHRITQRYADFFDETTCSVFVKMDTHPYVLIGAGGQNTSYTAAFNIDPAFTGNRLLGQGGLSTHTNLGAGYESYPNGWFRIWASGTTSGEDGWSLSISPDENTLNVTDWDAAGTEAIFAYGGQYEYAGFVTSYIPTNGAAVDRDADICTIEGDNFSSWFNQSEGTFVASAKLTKGNAKVPIFTTAKGTSGAAEYFSSVGIWKSNANVSAEGTDIVAWYKGDFNGSNDKAFFVLGDNSSGEQFNAAAAYINDAEFAASFKGQTAFSKSSQIPPIAPVLLYIGLRDNRGSALTIARLSYYPRRLSDEQLQALTS